jgi:hypothetical protein
MSQEPTDYGTEVRDTIVKSSLTGVAATVFAVTMFSPAVLGGVIGTSIASSFGGNANAEPADNVYANLPPFPAPLSQAELNDIRGQLERTEASLATSRAATDAQIDQMRSLAVSDDLVTFTPMASVGQIGSGMNVTVAPASVEQAAAVEPVSDVRATHLELAELLLAHENI